MSSAADHARRAASLKSLLARQEICAAHVGLAFDSALEPTGVRYTRVDPRGEHVFFTAVAFTFPIGIGGQESGTESARSDPVEMDIQKSVSEIPRQTLEAIALGLAAFADALRLCPGVTGNIGFRPVARFRRDSEGSRGDARAPGVAVTYDQQSDVPTTVFWTIADIAATDRATLADRICAAAPKSAEPGYTTPEKRLRTDDESAEYVRVMSLAPDAKGATTKRTKRALAL